jgi:acyl-CoA thioester hydrolase
MFTITVTPRFGDIDGFRHVNNTKLPEWFELGRMPVYALFEPDLNLDRLNLILARLSVDFHIPLILNHAVEIRTYIARVGNSSMTIYQEAWQRGQLCASGEAVVVHYDFQEQHSLAVPDDIRTQLMQHLKPETGRQD